MSATVWNGEDLAVLDDEQLRAELDRARELMAEAERACWGPSTTAAQEHRDRCDVWLVAVTGEAEDRGWADV